MGWPKRITFVRHGQSEGNIRTVEERAAFETASNHYALTPVGQQQAHWAWSWLMDHGRKYDVRYVSYYRRARETMDILQPKKRIFVDPRLAEASRGIWHSMSRDEMTAYFPFELKRKEREGLYHYRPFGGENWPDIEARIWMWLTTIARDYEDQNVLVVCHGHWFILFQRLIERFSIEEAVERYRMGVIPNCGIVEYKRYFEQKRGKWRQRLRMSKHGIVNPWEHDEELRDLVKVPALR